MVERSEGHPIEYTYDQLKDLQSRLMLVAGEAEKGRDSVERFNLVFIFFSSYNELYDFV